jgi:cellobiose-specific phosphotransferase system component IIB
MAKKDKKPGRIKQLWRIYKITARNDSTALWLAILGFLVSIGVGLGIGFAVSEPGSFSFWLWPITGTTTGILVAMIVMSRRAERNAYMQIEGQAGAVGAVLDSQIRRKWRAQSTPIAVNAKSREAVYRMIGPAGVVLIGEGSSPRVSQMLEDESRKVQRAVPGVTVHKLKVNVDQGGIRLHLLLKSVYKLKKALNRSEVSAVVNRLSALSSSASLPIPKGIDPNKIRAPKRKV